METGKELKCETGDYEAELEILGGGWTATLQERFLIPPFWICFVSTDNVLFPNVLF